MSLHSVRSRCLKALAFTQSPALHGNDVRRELNLIHNKVRASHPCFKTVRAGYFGVGFCKEENSHDGYHDRYVVRSKLPGAIRVEAGIDHAVSSGEDPFAKKGAWP